MHDVFQTTFARPTFSFETGMILLLKFNAPARCMSANKRESKTARALHIHEHKVSSTLSLQHSTSKVLRFYALVAYKLGYLVHSPKQNLFIPVTLQSSQGSFTLAGFEFQFCTCNEWDACGNCTQRSLYGLAMRKEQRRSWEESKQKTKSSSGAAT